MNILDGMKRIADPASEIKIVAFGKEKYRAILANRLWTHSIGDLTGRLGSFVVTADGTGYVGPAVNHIVMDDDGKGMTVYFNTWIFPADADYAGIILAFGSYSTGEWYWLADKALGDAVGRGQFQGSLVCFEMHVARPEMEG